MDSRFKFDPSILNSVVGGLSAVDIPRLNIHSLEDAEVFLKTYGYDLSKPEVLEKTWYFHRRSIVLLTERLGYDENEIPAELRERKSLNDIRWLFVYASSRNEDQKKLQRWSCAILRVMHVYVHAENDLFASFSEEIQKQILGPIQSFIHYQGNEIALKASASVDEEIILKGFEVKPFKTSQSTVIKLLAKPDALAMKLFDKLGIRFITKSVFDSFRVIRFLVDQHIISFPHIMPDQSTNTVYPVDLFLKVCTSLAMSEDLSSEEFELILENELKNELKKKGDSPVFVKKLNQYSGENYKFIKFINRQLIHIGAPSASGSGMGPGFDFFYPYEIQILDKASYQAILNGPSEHQAYKERQRLAAQKRLFPDSNES
jgi:uncharacterized protein (TIGR04552 family)